MLLNRKPIAINDPAGDARFSGVRWDAAIRNIISAPLLVRSRLIGAVTLYNNQSPAGFTEDDRRLLAIIGTQSAQIVENARLYEEERALIRVREELRLAAEIQQYFLPDDAPSVPGYELAGRSIPAQSVGGDYFDYIVITPDRVAACVADVSGKGLPAALMMANVQAALRAQAGLHGSAADSLIALNRLLHKSMRRGTFVTLVYGVLDAKTHTFDLANAGHNRPLICRADGTVEQIDTAGMLAGALAEISLIGVEVHFARGDCLFLYSDGVTEAMNHRREEYGKERLASLLSESRQQTSVQIVQRVIDSVNAHVGDADPHDDITVCVIKRLD
jgi:serine phosphatase RsbU (regulator of sigma subunit)